MPPWTIHATLEPVGDRYRLEIIASRTIDGREQNSCDVMMVDHPAEARMECARFAELHGVGDYVIEDRRAA